METRFLSLEIPGGISKVTLVIALSGFQDNSSVLHSNLVNKLQNMNSLTSVDVN